ncbi:unnamed protein product [Dovyalis caffra]|uniref:Uncharacterized GPI-anchored protein At5g19230-like domain-containing protein n=1 Tax=Dovyalis caffra TaxID=77055 RepID=A0AAV1RY62_9ROSI|nr:unnamed protein product [Dovyalis caffra]
MASLKIGMSVLVLLQAILLLSSPVLCDEEDDLLQGINSYRHSLTLPALVKHKNAGCLADKIADKLEDQPCTAARAASAVQIESYPDLVSKCGIDVNHTTEGVVLPVCVPHLVPTLLLTNYTRTTYAKYINDSRFSGAGLGHEDDWMVMVLTTSTPRGDFAGAISLVSKVGFGHCLGTLLLGVLVYLIGVNLVERRTRNMEEKKRKMKKKEKTRRTSGHFGLKISLLSIAERNQAMHKAKPNALVKHGFASAGLLCNEDIKENLVAAFTFKEKYALFLMLYADEEHKLFKNINVYRTLFLDIPALTKNKKARCVAKKISVTLKKPCNETTRVDKVKLDSYPHQLTDCIGINHTADGVVLPVCAPADEEHELFQNINAYRTLFLDIPVLTKNKKARCLANKIVNSLEKPCNETTPVDKVKLDRYPHQLKSCIGINHTTDGVVLPVCAPADGVAAVPLLHNYTRTRYANYLKDSNFTGVGISYNDYWMVVVLKKNTSRQSSSASANGLVSKVGFGHDEEDNLLENINAHRKSYLGIPALTENKKATCLANQIVDTLLDLCNADEDPAAMAELNDYPEQLQNCLKVNHAEDGVVLLICEPKNGEEAFLYFHNYTRMSKVGIVIEEEGGVLVLAKWDSGEERRRARNRRRGLVWRKRGECGVMGFWVLVSVGGGEEWRRGSSKE